MQKREPVIIAPDYNDDELYEWMRQKINAAQDLKWANEARAKQAENLSALEQDITKLEKAAALSIARMITYPR
ncbi:protein YdfC [Escherichia coli]